MSPAASFPCRCATIRNTPKATGPRSQLSFAAWPSRPLRRAGPGSRSAATSPGCLLRPGWCLRFHQFKIARGPAQVDVVEERILAIHWAQGDAGPGELAEVGVEIARHHDPVGWDLIVDGDRRAVTFRARPGMIAELARRGVGWSPVAVVV